MRTLVLLTMLCVSAQAMAVDLNMRPRSSIHGDYDTMQSPRLLEGDQFDFGVLLVSNPITTKTTSKAGISLESTVSKLIEFDIGMTKQFEVSGHQFEGGVLVPVLAPSLTSVSGKSVTSLGSALFELKTLLTENSAAFVRLGAPSLNLSGEESIVAKSNFVSGVPIQRENPKGLYGLGISLNLYADADTKIDSSVMFNATPENAEGSSRTIASVGAYKKLPSFKSAFAKVEQSIIKFSKGTSLESNFGIDLKFDEGKITISVGTTNFGTSSSNQFKAFVGFSLNLFTQKENHAESKAQEEKPAAKVEIKTDAPVEVKKSEEDVLLEEMVKDLEEKSKETPVEPVKDEKTDVNVNGGDNTIVTEPTEPEVLL